MIQQHECLFLRRASLPVFSLCSYNSPAKRGGVSWVQCPDATAERQRRVGTGPRPLNKVLGSLGPDSEVQGPLAGAGVSSLAYLQPPGPFLAGMTAPLLPHKCGTHPPPSSPGSSCPPNPCSDFPGWEDPNPQPRWCWLGVDPPLKPWARLVSLPAARWPDEGCISEQSLKCKITF